MKFNELVNKNYERLTANDYQILERIYEKKYDVYNLTCNDLANICHVSRATLLRFCRKLELNSFAELKYLLKSSGCESQENFNINIEEACEVYHNIIDEIKENKYEEVCSLIYKAKTIYIYGTGNSQKAEADEFKRIFLLAGKCVIDLFDLGEIQLIKKTFSNDDVFVIISLSGETQEGIEILRTIENTKINTISITRFQNNTIARLCNNNLYVSTKMLHGLENLSYEITAAFYVILDILFVRYIEYIKEIKL